jgi:hypothetical protein
MPVVESIHALLKIMQAYDTFIHVNLWLLLKWVVLNYIACIQIPQKNVVLKNSKHFLTCTKISMISC